MGTAVALLAQGAPPADFIRDHATFVAWAIGAMLLIIVAQGSAGVGWVHREFKGLKAADQRMAEDIVRQISDASRTTEARGLERMELGRLRLVDVTARVDKVDERIGAVEKVTEATKEHVGAGDAALTRIATAQDRLAASFESMQVENVEAHSAIIQGRVTILERLTAVETRTESVVAQVKAAVPNGEIKALTSALNAMMERLDNAARRGARR